VKLLTRYVIREHVGPLLFSLSAMTSLLMLQYVARQLANLAGKGLPWAAIGQFFVLSLPFTIAMTMPMAVLMATLYAFGRLAAEREITALKASGVRVRSLMAPVLLCAFLLSLLMVWFNDQVLPAANHRLRVLQSDIARTKPTLALREQVLNPLSEQFFMRVARVDAGTNRITDVIVYDLRGGPERKTIYADSGLFSVARNGQDLQLQLFDGFAQEFSRGDARRLQRSFFKTQTVKIGGVSQGFERSTGDTYKGERELTVCEMHRRYAGDAREFMRFREEYISNLARLEGSATVRAPRTRPAKDPLSTFYCEMFLGRVAGLLLPKTAKAQPPVQRPPVQQPPVQQPPVQQPPVQQQPPVVPPTPPGTPRPGDTLRPAGGVTPAPATPAPATPPVDPAAAAAQQAAQAAAQQAAQAAAMQAQQAAGALPGGLPMVTTPADSAQRADSLRADSVARGLIGPAAAPPPPATPVDTMQVLRSAVEGSRTQLLVSREGLDSLAVEIHKKFALSFACFVFVLFGPPIALRFPRGGVGVTIGVSIVVFGLYYICLMGGESMAEKGRLPAWLAMWIANVIFTVAGVVFLWRIERTTDGSRGGGLRDWWANRKANKALATELAARAGGAA